MYVKLEREEGAMLLGSVLSLTLGYLGFNHFYLSLPLSIQMPFHIRKLQSALLMQDLLALLSNSARGK